MRPQACRGCQSPRISVEIVALLSLLVWAKAAVAEPAVEVAVRPSSAVSDGQWCRPGPSDAVGTPWTETDLLLPDFRAPPGSLLLVRVQCPRAGTPDWNWPAPPVVMAVDGRNVPWVNVKQAVQGETHDAPSRGGLSPLCLPRIVCSA